MWASHTPTMYIVAACLVASPPHATTCLSPAPSCFLSPCRPSCCRRRCRRRRCHPCCHRRCSLRCRRCCCSFSLLRRPPCVPWVAAPVRDNRSALLPGGGCSVSLLFTSPCSAGPGGWTNPGKYRPNGGLVRSTMLIAVLGSP